MTYRAKYQHAKVYSHDEPSTAEHYPVSGCGVAGLSLMVISAGSVVGLVLIVIAKLMEGR
jgi:hypothetical protein